jgi:Heavy metal binding domain
MKNKSIITLLLATMLTVFMCASTSISFAQTKKNASMMKDCCMMKDGKMMVVKNGKMMTMKKNMTMKNGTKCMTNGECIMKDGTKMQMKDGECMDMKGKMDNCDMMKKDMAMTYTCPMHAEIVKSKPGKCPKCGMDLVVKK